MAALVSSGRPPDGAKSRDAPRGVTAAVLARRQGATATAGPREAGRERGGRAEGPARAHGRVETSWWSGAAPGRTGGAPERRAGSSGSSGGRDDEGGVSGGQGSSVDASRGGGQDASWLTMVKSRGFWLDGVAEARTLKSVVLTKPLVPLVLAK